MAKRDDAARARAQGPPAAPLRKVGKRRPLFGGAGGSARLLQLPQFPWCPVNRRPVASDAWCVDRGFLLVDDDPSVIRGLWRMLRRCRPDFQISTAGSAFRDGPRSARRARL